MRLQKTAGCANRKPPVITGVGWKARSALLGSLLIVLAVPALAQKMPRPDPVRGTRPGNLAHAFNLKDLDGRPYDLAALNAKGRVVHLVFWATWCFPCIEEVPELREAYAQYRDRGLEILGVVVNINQTREGVRSFIEDYKVNYPILWDDGGIAERYGVAQIPQNFLIDRDGIIRHAGAGLPSDYHDLLEGMLGKNGPAE